MNYVGIPTIVKKIKKSKYLYTRKEKRNFKNMKKISACYNKGVFYLGHIIHYFGDSGFFTHVTDSINFNIDNLKKFDHFLDVNESLREFLSERTDGKPGFSLESLKYVVNNRDSLRLYDFFKIDLTKYNLFQKINSQVGLRNIAFGTCYGSNDLDDISFLNSGNLIKMINEDVLLKMKLYSANWQFDDSAKRNTLEYQILHRIQECLELVIVNTIWWLNDFISNIFKYNKHDYHYKKKKIYTTMAHQKEKFQNLTLEFRKTFRYFYHKVKEYFEERGYTSSVYYSEICDYISGHLSAEEGIDREWRKNDWSYGGHSKELVDQVYEYCQKKIRNGQKEIEAVDPLLE